MTRNALLAVAALSVLAACAPKPAEKAAEAPAEPAAANAASGGGMPFVNTAPAGLYEIDKAHTSVNFRISHMGLSEYTARFTKIEGKLNFDPANPEAMTVEATLNPKSIQTNYPDPKETDFDGQLAGKDFLDAAQFPQITFKSTKVVKTGDHTAQVTGDLSLHGISKPITLDVTFNGSMAPSTIDPGGRVGFSAKGRLKRSDFGMGFGIPAPGTNMGVGDLVEIAIETEFSKPQPKK